MSNEHENALSVAPAPVADDALLEWCRENGETVEAGNGSRVMVPLLRLQKLFAGKRLVPVQEGPKGVEPEAFIVERLSGEGYGPARDIVDAQKYDARSDEFWISKEARNRHRVTPLYAPAQSIPAAPCQCKPDDTTGWTDDDIMVPRCNVCGLVVMKVIAERKAERAAIDEEGREALEAAITFFGSFKDYRISAHDPEKDHMAKLIQDAHQFVIEKHIAALERLLAGN